MDAFHARVAAGAVISEAIESITIMDVVEFLDEAREDDQLDSEDFAGLAGQVWDEIGDANVRVEWGA